MVGVDEAVEYFLIVGNKEQRAAGPAFFLQQAQHALDAEKIEAIKRFVENDEVGIQGEGSQQIKPLLLAAA